MPERYSATGLRANLYQLLDRVLETGVPVEIERKGQLLRIEASPVQDRLSRLRPHPEAVRDELESLVHVDWSAEWRP